MKDQRKEWLLPGKKPGLYSDAVSYGSLVYTSGIVARNLDGSVFAPGDVEAQTRFVFDRITEILEMTGSRFANIMKMTIYLRNMEDRLKINPIRTAYFDGMMPASTAVEVSKLAHQDLLIEIEVVACTD